MFIGYLHCARCAYRTDTFLCLYHHWRGGYGVPVQDQETLAIRLVHVPDDPVFYTDDSGLSEADAEKAIEDYVASVLRRRHVPRRESDPRRRPALRQTGGSTVPGLPRAARLVPHRHHV